MRQGHFQVIHHSDTCCVMRYWQPLAANLIALETLTMMDLQSTISQAISGYQRDFPFIINVLTLCIEAREKEKQLIT